MIPLLDLEAQYRAVQEPLEEAVLAVLRSGAYVLGPPVAAFERDFAAHCGTREAVSVSTGTAALHLGLVAAGVRPGDEVITVGMTFVATVAAILYAGGKPVLVDVDPQTYTMDPAAFAAAITPAPARWCRSTCTGGSPTWRRSVPSPSVTASRSSRMPRKPTAPSGVG